MTAALRPFVPDTTSGWLLFAASLTAWLVLLLSPPGLVVSALCTSGATDWGAFPALMTMTVTLNPLSRLLASALLMIAAMMLPFAHAPLAEALAQRRRTIGAITAALFLGGFVCAGLAAVVVTTALTVLLRMATGGDGALALIVGMGVAALWQASGLKAVCLQRSRGVADRIGRPAKSALALGTTSGVACAGSCWALMLLPALVGGAHLIAMAGVTLLMAIDHRSPRMSVQRPGHRSGRGMPRLCQKGASLQRCSMP